jgi:FtsZ-interacting cell division protein ZipA
MLKLLRAAFHEPLLTGLLIVSVLLVIAMVISALVEGRRNRKMMERRERARRLHQLQQQPHNRKEKVVPEEGFEPPTKGL